MLVVVNSGVLSIQYFLTDNVYYETKVVPLNHHLSHEYDTLDVCGGVPSACILSSFCCVSGCQRFWRRIFDK